MKTLLFIAIGALFLALFPPAMAAAPPDAYVQIAEIEIDPAQLENYKAAAKEQIEAAIRSESGVLTLYSVADSDNPTHITVYEIYRDTAAYQAHLQSVHVKKYKSATASMVKSLKLARVTPIMLGAKATRRNPKSN